MRLLFVAIKMVWAQQLAVVAREGVGVCTSAAASLLASSASTFLRTSALAGLVPRFSTVVAVARELVVAGLLEILIVSYTLLV